MTASCTLSFLPNRVTSQHVFIGYCASTSQDGEGCLACLAEKCRRTLSDVRHSVGSEFSLVVLRVLLQNDVSLTCCTLACTDSEWATPAFFFQVTENAPKSRFPSYLLQLSSAVRLGGSFFGVVAARCGLGSLLSTFHGYSDVQFLFTK